MDGGGESEEGRVGQGGVGGGGGYRYEDGEEGGVEVGGGGGAVQGGEDLYGSGGYAVYGSPPRLVVVVVKVRVSSSRDLLRRSEFLD